MTPILNGHSRKPWPGNVRPLINDGYLKNENGDLEKIWMVVVSQYVGKGLSLRNI